MEACASCEGGSLMVWTASLLGFDLQVHALVEVKHISITPPKQLQELRDSALWMSLGCVPRGVRRIFRGAASATQEVSTSAQHWAWDLPTRVLQWLKRLCLGVIECVVGEISDRQWTMATLLLRSILSMKSFFASTWPWTICFIEVLVCALYIRMRVQRLLKVSVSL